MKLMICAKPLSNITRGEKACSKWVKISGEEYLI